MIFSDNILQQLVDEIGFRGTSLSAANQKSNSGLFYQDASPMIDLELIRDVQNDEQITDDGFGTLLQTMKEQAVTQSLSKVFNGKESFLSHVDIYPNEKSFFNTLPKYNKFVGLRLQQVHSDFMYMIPWVELTFDADTSLTLYLYNSNKPNTPIQTKEINVTGGESTIVELGWLIRDDLNYKGGTFYLGYFDNLVAANAYKKDYNAASLRVYSPYYSVEPVRMPYEGSRIDVRYATETSESFGLNIGINVYSDYTNLIYHNKSLFHQLFMFQMHEIVMQKIRYSRRSNIEQRFGNDISKYVDLDLYGNKEAGIVGIEDKLAAEVDNIQKALFPRTRINRKTLR